MPNLVQLLDADPYVKKLLQDNSPSVQTPTPRLMLSPEGRVVLPGAAPGPTSTPALTPPPEQPPSAAPSVLDKIQTPIVREYMAKKMGLGPDTELEAAQDRADNRLMWAQLARAGAGLGTAISGSGKGVDNQFYDALERNAGRPVSKLMERRASQKERLAEQEAQAARARAQEEMDPNSQTSQLARQILGSRSPGTAKNMGGAFNLLSAAKIKELVPSIEKDLDRELRERQIAQHSEDLRFQARENAKSRALQAQLAREGRIADADAKRLQQLSERNVGGFTFDPSNPPSADAAKKMSSVAEAHANIMSGVDRLKANFDKNGAEVGFGSDHARQASERENIILGLKNLAELGVLNGRDYEILSTMVPDTSSFLGGTLTKKETFEEQFDAFKDQLNSRLQNAAKTYKYSPIATASSNAPAPNASPPHGQTVIQNGVTYTWNPETGQYE